MKKRISIAVAALALAVLFAGYEIAEAQVGAAIMAARRIKKRAEQQEGQKHAAGAQDQAAPAEAGDAGMTAEEAPAGNESSQQPD